MQPAPPVRNQRRGRRSQRTPVSGRSWSGCATAALRWPRSLPVSTTTARQRAPASPGTRCRCAACSSYRDDRSRRVDGRLCARCGYILVSVGGQRVAAARNLLERSTAGRSVRHGPSVRDPDEPDRGVLQRTVRLVRRLQCHAAHRAALVILPPLSGPTNAPPTPRTRRTRSRSNDTRRE